MFNRKYVLGFTILVLIFGFMINAAAIQNDPTGDQGKVYNNSGEQRTFRITIIDNPLPNNTVKWYINGIQNGSTQTDKTSSVKTLTGTAGNYNITVISRNGENASDTDYTHWTWVVTDAFPETAPIITKGPTAAPLDTSANISFSVNQSDAHIKIQYGTSYSGLNERVWNNYTNSNNRKITLTELSPGTLYYYNVTAANNSNPGLRTSTSIHNFTTLEPTVPKITNISLENLTSTSLNITFDVNQIDALARIKYGLDASLSSSTPNGTLRKIKISGLTAGTKYYYSVFAYNNFNQSYKSNSSIRNFTTKYSGPSLIQDPPSTPPIIITAGQSINLTVTIGSQGGNLAWYLNDGTTPLKEQNVDPFDTVNYAFKKNIKGTFNITANLSNENGSATARFKILNRPATYSTGSRIWDGDRYPDYFSTTYSWTPQSFSGFYYNPKDGIGSEIIEIELTGRSDREIEKNNIIYSTGPQEVYFSHKGWGKYQVIGFMADKYFAGYTNHTISAPTESFDEISAMAQGQLHKVLYDDDNVRKIPIGGALALKDGYVLKAIDIDSNGRTILLQLLKDGEEVDINMVRSGETYVYKKRAGYVDDLPLILVRVENVSSNHEYTGAFIKGIFQISGDMTNVRIENKFGIMEVVMVNKYQIVMKNRETEVNLTRGNKTDLMGDIKILVADNDDLRFTLSVERKGNVRVRSAVFDEDINGINKWTPYNFGMNIGKKVVGFYYDLDDGLGNERLSMTDRDGRSIPEKGLVYTTKPEEVLFTHDEWGRYQVIGFMANKYFAGYKGHDNSRMVDSFNETSAMAHGQLHKILIDDDTKHVISVGGTIALKDGYVLKATDIDLNGRTMFLVLSKDGKEVDSNEIKAGETYVYKKKVGSVDDLPLILVRFDGVFAGQELQAALMKGIFQISETATKVKMGGRFGRMEVMRVNDEEIVMKNSNDINLYRNRNNKLMGNIRLKVADSDTLRFYFEVHKKIGLS